MRTIRKRTPDAQRALPLAQCWHCGRELYAGMTCWRLAGRTLCEDCAAPWLLEELAGCRTVCGEAEQ